MSDISSAQYFSYYLDPDHSAVCSQILYVVREMRISCLLETLGTVVGIAWKDE